MSVAAASGTEHASSAVEPRDVVFTFSYVTWSDTQRRGMSFAQDRLLQTLLRDPGVGRLIVANPWRALAGHLRSGLSGRSVPFPAAVDTRLHAPLRMRRRDPASIDGLERSYRRYDRRLRQAAERAGMERPAVITMHPLIAGFAQFEWAGPVTFYCTDDWSAHPGYRRWWPAYREAYERVRAAGHGLCAVSDAIVERIRPSGPHAVVPNGIEPSEWAVPGAAPEWFTALPGPRLLYLGTLDSRLDHECVRQAAAAVPGGSVVLVGATGDPGHTAPLRTIPNVHLHEVVRRPGVPGLLGAADACLIPHARTALTTAMSPLKLYEYLAAGRPVASVDLPPLRGMGSRVVLADSPGGFGEAVRRALAMGPQREDERQRVIDEHSWNRRHERVLELALRPA
jgi:hypothetical protein